MATDYSWLTPMMTKGLFDGMLFGFKMIWMVVISMPWQIFLLLLLRIGIDLISSNRKRKCKVW
jgi:hypothetical protein